MPSAIVKGETASGLLSTSSDRIVCPCCPLYCDDLTGSELSSSAKPCELAYKRLSAVFDRGTGSTASEPNDEQLSRSAEALRTSKRTIITGRVLDLATSRAVVKFSERTGAEIQVTGPNRSAHAVMKRDGSYTCTLGELTRPASSLLIIGDVELAWPRVSQHLKEIKELAQLDDSSELLDQLAVLRLAAASQSVTPLPATLERPSFIQAMELVGRAGYLIVLVAPLREDSVRSPLVWSSILGLIQTINRSRRAALLTLDETYTLRSTMASQMDRVPQGVSTFEPTLKIHLSPFGEMCDIKSQATIHIGLLPSGSHGQPWLAASTPGVDNSGIAYRGDGSVALPLMAWTTSSRLPTPAERLEQLLRLS